MDRSAYRQDEAFAGQWEAYKAQRRRACYAPGFWGGLLFGWHMLVRIGKRWPERLDPHAWRNLTMPRDPQPATAEGIGQEVAHAVGMEGLRKERLLQVLDSELRDRAGW